MNKVAIIMRIVLDGESLNNEGTIGNVIKPREIELRGGSVRAAIAGEMLKHYHTRNLTLLADQDELCDTCKIFSPMKNGLVKNVDINLSASGNKVRECIIDDIEGHMNVGDNPEVKRIKDEIIEIKKQLKEDKNNEELKNKQNELENQIKNISKNEKRTSCIKFSWAIATEENEYQSVLHSRVDPTEKNNYTKEESKDTLGVEDTTSEANTNSKQNTQMIFYRPIRSNEYALTIEVELDRIGYDDEKLIYAVDDKTIKERQKKCIKAVKNMFLDIEGALCSTRLPHLGNIHGILIHKTDKHEVLAKYSALNDDFITVNEELSTTSYKFDNIMEFANTLDNLIK